MKSGQRAVFVLLARPTETELESSCGRLVLTLFTRSRAIMFDNVNTVSLTIYLVLSLHLAYYGMKTIISKAFLCSDLLIV